MAVNQAVKSEFFYSALQAGNATKAHYMLEAHPALLQERFTVNDYEGSALHLAIKKFQKPDVVGVLLDHGASIFTHDSDGRTPVRLACTLKESAGSKIIYKILRHILRYAPPYGSEAELYGTKALGVEEVEAAPWRAEAFIDASPVQEKLGSIGYLGADYAVRNIMDYMRSLVSTSVLSRHENYLQTLLGMGMDFSSLLEKPFADTTLVQSWKRPERRDESIVKAMGTTLQKIKEGVARYQEEVFPCGVPNKDDLIGADGGWTPIAKRIIAALGPEAILDHPKAGGARHTLALHEALCDGATPYWRKKLQAEKGTIGYARDLRAPVSEVCVAELAGEQGRAR